MSIIGSRASPARLSHAGFHSWSRSTTANARKGDGQHHKDIIAMGDYDMLTAAEQATVDRFE